MCFFGSEGHEALDRIPGTGYDTLLLRMIPGDLLSAFPHRQFHTLPGLLDSWAALPNSYPNALRSMQGGSLYHFYGGLWYDPAGRRTHDLPCERLNWQMRFGEPKRWCCHVSRALGHESTPYSVEWYNGLKHLVLTLHKQNWPSWSKSAVYMSLVPKPPSFCTIMLIRQYLIIIYQAWNDSPSFLFCTNKLARLLPSELESQRHLLWFLFYLSSFIEESLAWL